MNKLKCRGHRGFDLMAVQEIVNSLGTERVRFAALPSVRAISENDRCQNLLQISPTIILGFCISGAPPEIRRGIGNHPVCRAVDVGGAENQIAPREPGRRVPDSESNFSCMLAKLSWFVGAAAPRRSCARRTCGWPSGRVSAGWRTTFPPHPRKPVPGSA